jgi:hypothetical protein
MAKDSKTAFSNYKSAALNQLSYDGFYERTRYLRDRSQPPFVTLDCTPLEYNRLAATCELEGSALTGPFSSRLFRRQVDSSIANLGRGCCFRYQATRFSTAPTAE